MCQEHWMEVRRGERVYFTLARISGSSEPNLVGIGIIRPEHFWKTIIGLADYGIRIHIVDLQHGSYEGFVVTLSGSSETITLTALIIQNVLALSMKERNKK